MALQDEDTVEAGSNVVGDTRAFRKTERKPVSIKRRRELLALSNDLVDTIAHRTEEHELHLLMDFVHAQLAHRLER